jgi:hypothetical protein
MSGYKRDRRLWPENLLGVIAAGAFLSFVVMPYFLPPPYIQSTSKNETSTESLSSTERQYEYHKRDHGVEIDLITKFDPQGEDGCSVKTTLMHRVELSPKQCELWQF